MKYLYVGIDVSKENASTQGIDGEGKKMDFLNCWTSSQSIVTKHRKKRTKVMVAMESTASYHVNLFSYLTAKRINTVIVNPLLISNFTKLSLRKTKTDKKDALVIAQFILIHKDSLTQLVLSSEISDLRDISRQRESLVDQMTAVKHEIKRLLNITFPELEKVKGLFTKSILRLLRHYPSADSIKRASHSDISKIIIPGSMGKNTAATVESIKKAAEMSVGTNSFSREMIIKQKASILTHLGEHLDEITYFLIERCQSAMYEDMAILKSIRGIGDKTAMNFLTEIGGDIEIYSSHKKLIAMSGLDPSVCQSGKYEGASKISKRGNRHLRRVIWLMTTKVVIFNDYFKDYYAKRKQDGLPYKKAILATAHKLIRIIYAMLSNKTSFNVKAY